ncbi:MAG: hypothetical protein ACR2OE_04730 [Thermomicrobiales bacterium]
MSTVVLLHDRLATTVVLFFVVVGLWGLLEFARGGAIGGNIAGAFIIGQILIVVQGLLGLVLLVLGDRPHQMLHILYGFTAALVLPFVWSYVRDRAPRQGLMLYSIVALFIVGLAIRGITTGS